jgi:type VI protein secretion system component VasK
MFVLKMLSEGGEGPNTELVWLLYTGISLFFLVIVSGWISSARKKAQAQTEPAHEPARHEEHEDAHAVKAEEVSPKKDKGGKKK